MIPYSKTSEYFVERAEGMPTMPTMHYHQSYELYYLEAGNREYFVEDRFFKVSPGDFILIGPSKLHRTGAGYSVRTIIGFTEEFLARTYMPSAIKHMVRGFDKLMISPPEEMREEFLALMKSFTPGMNPTAFAINLGFLLQKLSSCEADSAYNMRVSRIVKYINQNFATIRSIENIADEFHVSKHYLCRLFKESMGITLIDYLNAIKIRNACYFLETSDKDMLEISELCGFNSSAYFSNVFKKMMGRSPSVYRKFLKNERLA